MKTCLKTIKNRLFLIILFICLLADSGIVKAGSIDLVITGVNGNPLSSSRKSITLNPSDVISIDVIYVSDPNYALFGIYADAYLEGTGSGWFDISELIWPENFWEYESIVQLNGDGSVTINTADWDAIAADTEPVTVLSNILFHYTGAGSIHIALRENPDWPGNTIEVDEQWQGYVIEDYGSGVDILNVEPGPTEDIRLPVQLKITGPDQIWENSNQQYNAIVYYDNGDILTVTNLSDWQVEPSVLATVSDTGKVTTGQLVYPQEMITLYAVYDENDVNDTYYVKVEAEMDITVNATVTLPELIERNLDTAKQYKTEAIEKLTKARELEWVSFNILDDRFKARDWSLWSAGANYVSRVHIFIAIIHEKISERFAQVGSERLQQVEDILAADANSAK